MNPREKRAMFLKQEQDAAAKKQAAASTKAVKEVKEVKETKETTKK